MDRARRAAFAAVFLVMAFGLVLVAAGSRPSLSVQTRPVAAVSWAVSTLVLSELQTGGASASDEFVELANAGSGAVDLAGLEVVYVTASGGTVTRKAAWSGSMLLEPGGHLLLANSLGAHATVADVLYSGGLAATGGALVLRQIGGSPIDAVGWGDASNAFVEGSAAAAPAAGSSLERRPGGLEGNGLDTNDNGTDFFVQGSPSPQALAAPPVPASGPPPATPGPSELPAPTTSVPPPTASPVPGETNMPTATPSQPATPTAGPATPPPPDPTSTPAPSSPAGADPSASPSGTPGSEPSPSSEPTPSASPDPGASAAPSSESNPSPSAAPSSEPSPSPSAAPSSEPNPSPSAGPSPSPAPSPSVSPSASPDPGQSPSAGPSASPAPSPWVSPGSEPTPGPSVNPSREPAASPVPIGDVRGLPTGSSLTLEGVLTTPLGLLEDGRSAFVEDATGGIALFLDAAPAARTPAGTVVRASGVVDERYAARTLRASLADVTILASAPLPAPLAVASGLVGEGLEGRRVTVTGRTSGAPTAYADGTGLLVDDGSGPVRAIVAADALAGRELPGGTLVTVSGPVGQRDSSGVGATGYRIYATLPGDLVLVPVEPSSSPSPASSASPSGPPPTSGPRPTGSPMPASTATPALPTPPAATPTPGGPELISIAAARVRSVGATVRVTGVVTTESGRLGTPSLLAVEDATGAIVLRLGDAAPAPARGTLVEAAGKLADPYGQLELRVDRLHVLGSGPLPAPLSVVGAGIGESTEARLVTIDGTVGAAPSKSSSHDIAFDIVDISGARVRVMADAASGLTAGSVTAHRAYRLTGIVGQRASRKGALDGYRIWLRDARDLTAAAPSPQPSSTASGALPIAGVLARIDAVVVIEGLVIAPATLLDATGRRVVLQDSSGAIEVLLPVGASAPSPGTWLRAEGVVGRAYGAPRLRATAVTPLGSRATIDVPLLTGLPNEALEWRLMRAAGRVVSVTRLGSRWRAEIQSGGSRVLVDGLPGAGIPSTLLVQGREVVVTGLIRRPYPGATDQRYALVPRSPQDVATASRAGVQTDGAQAAGTIASDRDPRSVASAAVDPVPDVDLATLGEHVGERVRVGGLVTEPLPSGFALDDGTAVADVRLIGPAAAYLGLLEPGDATNATGIVVAAADASGGWLLEVSAANGLVRVGDLGEPLALASPGTATLPESTAAPAPGVVAGRLELASLPGGTETAGLLTIVLASALTLTWPLLHRQRARRRATARLARRLASIQDSGPGSTGRPA